MPHRRITLGSGLNLSKTADTIRQLSESDQRVSLILDSAEDEHGWIHLRSIVTPTDLDALHRAWLLVVGYAGEEHPLSVFQRSAPETLEAARLVEWQQGLMARVMVDGIHEAPAMARLLRTLMIEVQGVRDENTILVALEYE